MKWFKFLLAMFLGCVAWLPSGAWANDEADRAQAAGEELAGREESGVWACANESNRVQAVREEFARRVGNARQWVDELARQFGSDDSPDAREKIVTELLERMTVRGRMSGVWQEGSSIANYEEIDRRFGADSSPAMRALVADALTRRAVLLRQCGYFEPGPPRAGLVCKPCPVAARAAFDDIERRFGQDDDPAVRAQYVRSLVEKGGGWESSADIAVYDDIVQRFGQDKSPAVRVQVIHALAGKAAAIGQGLAAEKAIDSNETGFIREITAVYDEIDRRFGKDDDPEVRREAAKALLAKLKGHKGQGNDTEATLAFYADINRRFGKDDATVRAMIAGDLLQNGFYDQVVQWFGQDEHQDVWKSAGEALFRKSERLLQQHDYEAALAVCDDIKRRFGARSDYYVARTLAMRGTILERQRARSKRHSSFATEPNSALEW
jgi:hypothetical protein